MIKGKALIELNCQSTLPTLEAEQLQLLVGEVEVTGHRRSQPGAAGVGRSCNEVLDEPAV